MAKIVLLSTRYDLGGASLLATGIAGQLRQRGHDAEAWCLYYHSERHEPPDKWVRILLTHRPRGLHDLLKMTNQLQRAMGAFRPNAFFGFQPLANVLGATVAAMTWCPRRFGGQHNPSNSQRWILRTLEKVIGSVVYTGNIAVSESVRSTYLHYPRLYRDKIKVIYNGIPSRGERQPKAKVRDEFGLPSNCFLVGTVGQHDTDQKNHGFLIDLLPLLPDVHLVIAGNGRHHEQLKERIATLGVGDRAHLVGSIPQRSVERLLDTLDVFLFPSRFEGFSLALLEAMQSGLPIVGNDITMIREALRAPDQDYGFLIPTDDPVKWSEIILSLRNNPQSLALWSKRAVEGARRFSLESMIGAYERAAADNVTSTDPTGLETICA